MAINEFLLALSPLLTSLANVLIALRISSPIALVQRHEGLEDLLLRQGVGLVERVVFMSRSLLFH